MGAAVRTGIAILLALALLVAATPASGQTEAPAPQGSSSPILPDLEDEVMCPTCGTALGLSESPQASQIRGLIRTLEREGLDKEQIKDRLVVEYGPEVLAVPDTSGFDLMAWLVPGLAIIASAIGLTIGARRWRQRGEEIEAIEAAAGPVGETSPADQSRLEADLDRYEL